ncbi:hypothetical protein NLU13_0482 [Sarocladium strictum]|uniref:DAGKc domain-containing protein n=1 Tax=Sarocladium strictum TaxID=5046 RepID=A0AA39LBH0_SARSR|nr:hypothetical protein NLU13_0482 [Sarocladium strictum]
MNLIPVEGVALSDGRLSWKTTADGSLGSAKEAELIFVLKSADLEKTQFGFVLCVLKEDAGNPANPYNPFFLATHTPPDHLPQRLLITALPPHLSSVPVDVIVSVRSGTNLALAFWETVLQPIHALSREILLVADPAHHQAGDALIDVGEPHVVVTQSAHSVRQYARALAAPGNRGQETAGAPPPGSRTILLLSGDGGVVDLLNGRRDGSVASSPRTDATRSPVIALMPLGTGNALFHSLHKPIAATAAEASPLVLALRTLFSGCPAKLPTFRASFSQGSRVTSFAGAGEDGVQRPEESETPVDSLQGAIVASYGFHASVVYESDTPEYRVHGAKRFGMVAQDLLRESHPYRAHVDIRRTPLAGTGAADTSATDEETSKLERVPRDSHAYVLTTLVSNLEQTFSISPDSRPLDGQLRLVHFAPIGGERTMAAMMAAYDGGKHVGMKWSEDGEEIGYEQVDEVRVTVLEEEQRWRKVCVDGTIVEIPQGGYMSVTKGDDAGGFQVLVDPRILKA